MPSVVGHVFYNSIIKHERAILQKITKLSSHPSFLTQKELYVQVLQCPFKHTYVVVNIIIIPYVHSTYVFIINLYS